jgi:NAD(P)-dependent dehydrogenase (short-subunit alcohol dehydrogenase family)
MTPGGELAGKTAIVTGASSGIGAAIAEALAREGADVALSGRNEETLEGVAQTIRSTGASAHVVAQDLALDDEPARLVESTREALSAVNVVVHSAGIFEPGAFVDTPIEAFDRQFALNVRAGFLLAQAAARKMSAGDAIIFVSSIAGHVAFPNSVAYCGTKGAIELMTKAMCTELSPLGIRVNAVAPGNIKTPMNAPLRAEPGYEDRASYMHGASLLVDGGWTAR